MESEFISELVECLRDMTLTLRLTHRPLCGPMSSLLIAGVHRPPTPAYIFSPPRPDSDFSFFFFFILTLINCGEIMFPSPYNGKPALHIVVLAVMNCPSGPFWSEFLMSTPEMESFHCAPGLESSHGEEFFACRSRRVAVRLSRIRVCPCPIIMMRSVGS